MYVIDKFVLETPDGKSSRMKNYFLSPIKCFALDQIPKKKYAVWLQENIPR